ncbi:MAG: hypothetical protein FD140_4573 [Limisphaerales bacterium]|nr:MAG: hypothetical protein FD140_4573 [Limisphaerales bacterium]
MVAEDGGELHLGADRDREEKENGPAASDDARARAGDLQSPGLLFAPDGDCKSPARGWVSNADVTRGRVGSFMAATTLRICV